MKKKPLMQETLNYEKLEEQKAKGWNLYHESKQPSERADGLFMVMEAHYLRNPKAPSLVVYASHWLWASQDQYDKEVLNILIARYPLPRIPQIQPGYSDWGSYGGSCYVIRK